MFSKSCLDYFILCFISCLCILQGVHIQPEGLQLLLQWSWGGAMQPRACSSKPLPLLERAGDDRQVSQVLMCL